MLKSSTLSSQLLCHKSCGMCKSTTLPFQLLCHMSTVKKIDRWKRSKPDLVLAHPPPAEDSQELNSSGGTNDIPLCVPNTLNNLTCTCLHGFLCTSPLSCVFFLSSHEQALQVSVLPMARNCTSDTLKRNLYQPEAQGCATSSGLWRISHVPR